MVTMNTTHNLVYYVKRPSLKPFLNSSVAIQAHCSLSRWLHSLERSYLHVGTRPLAIIVSFWLFLHFSELLSHLLLRDRAFRLLFLVDSARGVGRVSSWEARQRHISTHTYLLLMSAAISHIFINTAVEIRELMKWAVRYILSRSPPHVQLAHGVCLPTPNI